MKGKVTISLNSEVLKVIDSIIDKKEMRSRSHVVESLVLKALDRTTFNTAIILAGGRGKRLLPVTRDIPKPMLKIHGKPILEHQIKMLKKNGLGNIILSVGYRKNIIKKYFGDGKKFGVSIKYANEDKPMGTAGAISLARKYIKGTFAVMNADTLMKPNIREMYEFHKKQKKLGTVMLVSSKDTSNLGVAVMRGSGIVAFAEKPAKSISTLVNAGLYIFEFSVLNFIPKRKSSIERDVFPKLSSKNELSGFIHDGPVLDVGTPKNYEIAKNKWK